MMTEVQKLAKIKVLKELLKEYELLAKYNGGTDYDRYCALDMAIRALKNEPKTGRWIDGHCSECGCDVPAYIDDWKWQKDMDAKFCPYCGASMKWESKEE